jgi:hypothetical protein
MNLRNHVVECYTHARAVRAPAGACQRRGVQAENKAWQDCDQGVGGSVQQIVCQHTVATRPAPYRAQDGLT